MGMRAPPPYGRVWQVESALLRDVGAAWAPHLFVDVHTGDLSLLTPLNYKAEGSAAA